jgi:hypothetical protein
MSTNGIASKIRETGFRFQVDHFGGSNHPRTEVIITTTDRWSATPEAQDTAWAATLLDHDLVAAVRIFDRFDDTPLRAKTEADPDEAFHLKRVRAHILDCLENWDDIRHIELQIGGNGAGIFNVELEGDCHGESPSARIAVGTIHEWE